MRVEIDADNKLIYVDGKLIYPAKETKSEIDLVTAFNNYHGDTEYTGIVAKIQKWFYGTVVQASWCATSMSYFCNEIGKLDAIGGKNENVYHMMEACRKASAKGYGTLYEKKKGNLPKTVKKNDILFWLWSGDTMGVTSNKHVGVAEYDSSSDTIYCLGGNQKDKICTQAYKREKLYALYRFS